MSRFTFLACMAVCIVTLVYIVGTVMIPGGWGGK